MLSPESPLSLGRGGITKMRAGFMFTILISIGFLMPSTCLAREFSYKDGVFTIDVLDDWDVEEDTSVCDEVRFTPKSEKAQGFGMKITPCIRLDPERGIIHGVETPLGMQDQDVLEHNYSGYAAPLCGAEEGV